MPPYVCQFPLSKVAARIPLPTPSGPPEGELPEGQEKPPWGVSPGEGILPLLPQRVCFTLYNTFSPMKSPFLHSRPVI